MEGGQDIPRIDSHVPVAVSEDQIIRIDHDIFSYALFVAGVVVSGTRHTLRWYNSNERLRNLHFYCDTVLEMAVLVVCD